jgi:hypothetical protein
MNNAVIEFDDWHFCLLLAVGEPAVSVPASVFDASDSRGDQRSSKRFPRIARAILSTSPRKNNGRLVIRRPGVMLKLHFRLLERKPLFGK